MDLPSGRCLRHKTKTRKEIRVMRTSLKSIVLGLTSILVLAGDASADPLGAKLGSYNGVTCYSNGTSGRWSSKDPLNSVTIQVSERYKVGKKWKTRTIDKSIVTGYKWQCVEYVNRYYALQYGLDIGGGNGADYYGRASKKGLAAYKDGGKILPIPGDIVCWGGGPGGYGHVAVVREVGSDYVKVIEQNRLCTKTDADHKITMTVKRDANGKVTSVTIDPKGVSSKGGYFTQGWLRY